MDTGGESAVRNTNAESLMRADEMARCEPSTCVGGAPGCCCANAGPPSVAGSRVVSAASAAADLVSSATSRRGSGAARLIRPTRERAAATRMVLAHGPDSKSPWVCLSQVAAAARRSAG
jgi:hypothetical protein